MNVSIVIPLYNKKDYIGRCLQSALAQTHQDLEVVVINDGSTDGGETEASKFSDRRVRLFHQANQGVSAARNAGVEAAQSDVIFFLDADDTWHPTLVEEIVKVIDAHPDVGVFSCATRKIFADGYSQIPEFKYIAFEAGTYILKNYFQTYVELGYSPFSNSSFCVRRKFFDLAGKYTVGVRLTEDSDLWVRLTLISQIAFLPSALADYHVEVLDNTRTIPQTSTYEVTRTLQRALSNGSIPKHLRTGASGMLALQKNSQSKRLILLGLRSAALRRLLDIDPWLFRPKETMLLLMAALSPRALFLRAYRRKLARS